MADIWRREVSREHWDEVAGYTAESLGLRVEGDTLIYPGGQTEKYGSPESAERALENAVSRQKRAALIERYGACSEMIPEGRVSRVCGKPVEAEGVCIHHLRGKRRREANRRREDVAEVQRKREDLAAEARAQSICRQLGIQAHRPYRSGSTGRYSTTTLEVSMAELETLADRLGLNKESDR